MRWTFPNTLTTGRLLAAPAFALCFVVFDRPTADILALLLFIGASLTDFLDGHLARRWKQITPFGRMLDPIADKAMVIIALAVLIGISALDPWVLVPAALILFREVFVSGLREFLGASAGKLQVTSLAKWKTTVQMVAVSVLLVAGVFDVWATEATRGVRFLTGTHDAIYVLGVVLLWIAGVLTLVTGLDYFRKSLPFLSEEPE